MSRLNAAKAIRENLKAEGWNARQVSVRASRGGCKVSVTIRDVTVSEARVRKISEAYRVENRDHGHGGLLCGGNTFIYVNWANNAVDKVSDRLPLHDVRPGNAANSSSPTLTVGRLKIWRTPDHLDNWRWDILPGKGESWTDATELSRKIEEDLRDGGASIFRCWDRQAAGQCIARAILSSGIDLDKAEPATCEEADRSEMEQGAA